MIVESSDSGHTHSICYHVTLTEFRTPEVRLQPAKNDIMILRHVVHLCQLIVETCQRMWKRFETVGTNACIKTEITEHT